MKQQQTYKKYLSKQDWYADRFDRAYGCWSANHKTLAKNKVFTKRLAKHRLRQIEKEQIKQDMENYDE